MLLGILLFLCCAMGVLVYETNGLITEFESFIFESSSRESTVTLTPDQQVAAFSTMIREKQSHFFSTILVALIAIMLTTLILSLRHVIRSVREEDHPAADIPDDISLPDTVPEAPDMVRSEIFEALEKMDALLEEDEPANDPDEEFTADFEFIDDEDEGDSGVLADSYNKMVEALQRTNELEKELSSQLADANARLETEVSERKRAEKEIRHLSRQLISGTEEAQKKLAQDLHDEFGQTLAALHMGVEALWNSIPEEMTGQRDRITALIGLIEELGDKIRSISSDLRPDLLDDLGLIPTLDWYCREFTEKYPRISVDFQSVGFKKRISPEIELILYRIVQESLNNVMKYAKARSVEVMLTYSYPKVILMVRDDGTGFDPGKRTGGIGLIGMRERAVSVNGTVDIRSEKGKGTTIRGELPVS
ncbi:hypothetical protein DENIS_2938 [Desulfonema ishimotonii]|uniref:histidine kinase n=2 Tax=Desulfonema ishimotonii TaxID=45657 RepID=A0A401FYE0_9BACT|nr:hypothetical protein DENIS_2938 [Desulfonema ishimotonii]